jgi:hypothetical protein
MISNMTLNDTFTGRNDTYKFNLIPKVNRKYRKIITSIPLEFKFLIKMKIVGPNY